MLKYKAIEIFTSEEARYRKRPLVDAVLTYIKDLKIAARCIVTRGVAGCYENGELVTGWLEVLSVNMPVRIYIILPATETERVLAGLNDMITNGILALHELSVLTHRTQNSFFPRQLRVRDIMTADPQNVMENTKLNDTARLLLSSIFTGVPVVNHYKQPVGIITQGDLINRGGLPFRLGLLAESDPNRRDEILNRLSWRVAAEVMTTPAIMIASDRLLTEAVELMLQKNVKRLPVVDEKKRLVGILSRLDIFHTVMSHAPDWNAFTAQKLEVNRLKRVRDIMRRDVHAVTPTTKIIEVIQLIDDNDIQRVAVVDAEDKLLGVISDRDLLRYFEPVEEGISYLLAKVRHPFKQDPCGGNLQQCLTETSAEAVMNTQLITVNEEMLIEEAIGLIIEKGLKRLPVLDTDGRFKGMISRDSLLRAGFDFEFPMKD